MCLLLTFWSALAFAAHHHSNGAESATCTFCVAAHSAAFVLTFLFGLGIGAYAQSGSSTSITGTVVDPSGAVVTNATVEARNPVSGFSRSAATDASGKFTIPNVPFNPYHVTVTRQGFAPYAGDVDVRSTVPVNLNVTLQVEGSAER